MQETLEEKMYQSAPINWSALAALVIADLRHAGQTLLKYGLDARQLSALQKFPTGQDPYGRKILFASAEFEVMLATWAPGAHCSPHDHGHSNGAVWLVEGHFIEQHYSLSHELVATHSHQHLEEGRVLLVSPGDIHSMHAPSGGMSLHFYSPAVHAMKIFDTQSRRTLTLADDCGAWIPTNPDQIVSESAWPNR